MKCWKCGNKLAEGGARIPFKGTCDHCHAWLHCCKACKFYQEGQPNHCLIQGTEPISDRENLNYCDEFSLKTTVESESHKQISDVEKRLFGDTSTPKKSNFDSLFKED